MSNKLHTDWLREGVRKWNYRRKKVSFQPNLSGIRFFDFLPRDFRDKPKTSRFFEGIDLSDADPPVSGMLSTALLFLYFSGGRDRMMIWDIHRNENRLC